jgi:hypothetical protein
MFDNVPYHSHVVGFAPSIPQEGLEREFQDQNGSTIQALYNPLYKMANRCLSNYYAVIYGAEAIIDESGGNRVVENISKSEQTKDNISKGFLTVIGSNQIHEKCGANYDAIVKFWNSSVKEAGEKTKGKSKGTILFSAPDSYFKNDQHGIFMMFEEAMGRTFSNNTSMICWYLQNWLSNLSLASIIRVLTNHKYTIHSGWKYKEWTEKEIIDTVSKGIDKKLGEGTATLLFKTMRTVHKLDQDTIVPRPVAFEGILKSSMGEDSADPVIDSIREEFIEHMSFSKEATLTK